MFLILFLVAIISDAFAVAAAVDGIDRLDAVGSAFHGRGFGQRTVVGIIGRRPAFRFAPPKQGLLLQGHFDNDLGGRTVNAG